MSIPDIQSPKKGMISTFFAAGFVGAMLAFVFTGGYIALLWPFFLLLEAIVAIALSTRLRNLKQLLSFTACFAVGAAAMWFVREESAMPQYYSGVAGSAIPYASVIGIIITSSISGVALIGGLIGSHIGRLND